MAGIAALHYGMLGIDRGLDGMRRSAAQIASADQMNGERPAELAGPLVELQANSIQVQASTQVVKAVDEIVGTLFDDMA